MKSHRYVMITASAVIGVFICLPDCSCVLILSGQAKEDLAQLEQDAQFVW